MPLTRRNNTNEMERQAQSHGEGWIRRAIASSKLMIANYLERFEKQQQGHPNMEGRTHRAFATGKEIMGNFWEHVERRPDLDHFFRELLREPEPQEYLDDFLWRLRRGTPADRLERIVWISSGNPKDDYKGDYPTGLWNVHSKLSTAAEGRDQWHICALCDSPQHHTTPIIGQARTSRSRARAHQHTTFLLRAMLASDWALDIDEWPQVRKAVQSLSLLHRPLPLGAVEESKLSIPGKIQLFCMPAPIPFSSDLTTYLDNPVALRASPHIISLTARYNEKRNNLLFGLLGTDAGCLDLVKRAHTETDIASEPTRLDPSTTACAFLARLCRQVNLALDSNVSLIEEELCRMDSYIRRQPGIFKGYHLLYFKDYLACLKHACAHNVEQVKNRILPQLPRHASTDQVHGDMLAITQSRFEHADLIAEALGTRCAELHAINSDLLGLAEKRRSYIITFIIALLAPLALASSIFGMNIAAPDSTQMYWTNTTASEANSTLLTRTDQPTVRVWPAWNFGITAATITFGSLIVPLLAGPVARSFLRHIFIFRRRIWGLAFFIVAGVYIAAITVIQSHYRILVSQLVAAAVVPSVAFVWFWILRSPGMSRLLMRRDVLITSVLAVITSAVHIGLASVLDEVGELIGLPVLSWVLMLFLLELTQKSELWEPLAKTLKLRYQGPLSRSNTVVLDLHERTLTGRAVRDHFDSHEQTKEASSH